MPTNEIAERLTQLTNQIVADGKATCCGLLESLHQVYKLPFDRPIVWDAVSNNLAASDWSVRMLKLTPNGNVSQKLGPHMFISFCPFCGKELECKEIEDG